MAPDPESTRRHFHKDSRPRAEFPHRSAAHQSKHPAKGRAGGSPGESIDGTKRANSPSYRRRPRNAGEAAKIVEDQGDVVKIQGLDYRRCHARSSFEADAGGRDAVALARSRGIETNAAKIRGQAQDHVAPDKRP